MTDLHHSFATRTAFVGGLGRALALLREIGDAEQAAEAISREMDESARLLRDMTEDLVARPSLVDLLDLDGSRAQATAEAQGYDVRSTTSSEDRTVRVVMTAEFARLLAHALYIRADTGDEADARIVAFLRDLRKVNP